MHYLNTNNTHTDNVDCVSSTKTLGVFVDKCITTKRASKGIGIMTRSKYYIIGTIAIPGIVNDFGDCVVEVLDMSTSSLTRVRRPSFGVS